MYAQSPSKRFTRGIHLQVENSVERPSFSLGLTQDFGEVSGSMSKSNTMQEIKSKLKNNPIRLEGMSAKLKQSNIKIMEGEENAKRKEVVVSGLLEHDEDFGEVSGSMSKSNTMQEIKSKLKNNPIRLEGMSAKLKQSNIKIMEGEENAKRKEVVVSGLLEHDEIHVL
ncbi:hypothetical protein H5410_046580 [Solanum commersonii]|uniref:Uncharacterized protein n=1 Tax=Solanum commersonii TaxID=4109 RepID=A0A9J5XEP3_SOLCO|nr:hypothetical protein H5410_046580 [Solanum commersonii]